MLGSLNTCRLFNPGPGKQGALPQMPEDSLIPGLKPPQTRPLSQMDLFGAVPFIAKPGNRTLLEGSIMNTFH